MVEVYLEIVKFNTKNKVELNLVELKNKFIHQGRYTDCVDELIFKVVNAPIKRMKIEYV